MTTGGSILDAMSVARAHGARVSGAAAVVDRGNSAGSKFESLGIPYFALVASSDLGIPMVHQPA